MQRTKLVKRLRHRAATCAALVLLAGPACVPAQAAEIDLDETIEVRGRVPATPRPIVDSASTITRDTIERQQSNDLYDVVGASAGVAIDGGPRASGKSIAIRGFNDSEDILTRVDGATQNFEKYRYGTSLELDPDLVRTVEVLRGAATLTEGSGAIGGVVLAETLDAADLLAPDRRYGTRIRAGYTSNDEGRRSSASAYGRPLDALDLLVSGTWRDTELFELSDGRRLPDSAEQQWSSLLKAGVTTSLGRWSASHRQGRIERLEPFDATGNAVGLFGTVRRRTEDASTVLRYRSDGGADWLDAGVTLAYTDKRVTDAGSSVADGTDEFEYGIWTLDLRNDFAHRIGPVDGTLRVGVQGNREVRQALRDNALGRRINEAQPPGAKESWGAVLFERLRVHDFAVDGGLRVDRHVIDAKATSARLLAAQNRATRATYSRLSPAGGVTWTPWQGAFSLFYAYSEAFRVPLIDESFTIGTLSRCQSFARYVQRPSAPRVPAPFTAAPPSPPGPLSSFASVGDFLAALDAFSAAQARFDAALDDYLAALDTFNLALDRFQADFVAYLDNPLAAEYAMCGDDYEPELASTHELGAAYEWSDVWHDGDALRARLVYYRVKVEQTLESIYQDARTGEVRQQGQERRRGFEFELDYEAERWFGSLAVTTLDGEFDLRYFDNNRNPLVAAATTAADRGPQPLNSVPADRLLLSAGHRWPWRGFELGYRLRAVASRLVVTGTRDGCPSGLFILPACNEIGEQSGFVLHGAFLRWQPLPRVQVSVSGDNLTNHRYQLTGFGGGLGIEAPGRDVRLGVTVTF